MYFVEFIFQTNDGSMAMLYDVSAMLFIEEFDKHTTVTPLHAKSRNDFYIAMPYKEVVQHLLESRSNGIVSFPALVKAQLDLELLKIEHN